MGSTINWGILATGRIARKFAEGLRDAPGARLLAVGSRRAETAEEFAKQLGVPRAYGSYAALVNDAEVDVVYVASPHSSHHADTLLGLNAGKAVLCEKPMAINALQVSEMIQTARVRHLFLMEAMWTRYFPLMSRLRQWISADTLGELRMLAADFCYRSSPAEKPRLFDPELGGGALLDVGIYPVALASWLFGSPTHLASEAHLGLNGVDESCAIVLRHAKGELATLSAAICVETPQEAIISGTRGRVRIHRPWWQPNVMTLSRPGKTDDMVEFGRDGNGYQYEAVEAMNCLREGRVESERMPWDESLSIARTLDALRAQWGLRYPMEETPASGG